MFSNDLSVQCLYPRFIKYSEKNNDSCSKANNNHSTFWNFISKFTTGGNPSTSTVIAFVHELQTFLEDLVLNTSPKGLKYSFCQIGPQFISLMELLENSNFKQLMDIPEMTKVLSKI